MNNNIPSQEIITKLRNQYPQGTRVKLISMDDPYTNLKPGDRGFVAKVDDIRTVHIQWDNGSTLGAAYGADKIITNPYITDTLFKEIMSVCSAGQCNMLDTTAVQRYAFDHDYYNLVIFIESDCKTYAHFIRIGER